MEPVGSMALRNEAISLEMSLGRDYGVQGFSSLRPGCNEVNKPLMPHHDVPDTTDSK